MASVDDIIEFRMVEQWGDKFDLLHAESTSLTSCPLGTITARVSQFLGREAKMQEHLTRTMTLIGQVFSYVRIRRQAYEISLRTTLLVGQILLKIGQRYKESWLLVALSVSVWLWRNIVICSLGPDLGDSLFYF